MIQKEGDFCTDFMSVTVFGNHFVIEESTEFANRFKRLNLDIFVNVIMGISSYLANPADVLYGTMIYDRVLIQKDGLQKRP